MIVRHAGIPCHLRKRGGQDIVCLGQAVPDSLSQDLDAAGQLRGRELALLDVNEHVVLLRTKDEAVLLRKAADHSHRHLRVHGGESIPVQGTGHTALDGEIHQVHLRLGVQN